MQNNTVPILLGVAGLAVAGVVAFSMMGSPSASITNTNEIKETPMNNVQIDDQNTEMKAELNIVETAVNAGQFTTLVAAVKAAGLVETLSGEGPFTVFAPTDAAFSKLPEGTLEAVLADKEKLTAILTYHVVPGKVMAADVVGLTSAPTVLGQNLKVEVTEDGVMINNAKVVTTDIETSNGVIHVIDTVLLPQ